MPGRQSSRSCGARRATPRQPLLELEPESDSEADDEPQVHMAMCALRNLQLPEEHARAGRVMSAVAAGIAALEQQTPQTYREAMASPDAAKWKAALDKEMRSCMEQEVWTLVRRDQLPQGRNVLPCKEVFKMKLDEHGAVTEHKARFTPKGFRQKHGVDFFETFARTGQYKTLRVALSLAAKWDHELAQFDVPTAFLNAPVEEDIYMELPEGFEQPGMVCKLQKSLYGLKQAPRNWDKLVHAFITRDMAFKATVSDPSLYFKRSRSGRLMMIYRFVDDMQGSYHADDAAEFQQSVKLLQERFNIKQLQTATWMLGMRITRDRKARTITLDQELYVTKALEKFGLQQCRVVSTPEAVGAAHDANPALDQPADRQRYMEMTGTLMYAAISTRPDIAHAVHYLASHMQAPTQRHMQAAERVFRYLAGTKEVGLVFGSRNGDTVGDSRGRKAQVQVDVCAFADADWANDKGDRKSISGWVAKLNGDPVSWSSKKQRVVALSTCEAELYAEAAAIQEVLWLRGLMEELGLHTQTGSTVYGDNQSAIAVSENGVKGERTKHVDVKYHFVTETVERGDVKLRWVPTTQQQADIFTKALGRPGVRVAAGAADDLLGAPRDYGREAAQCNSAALVRPTGGRAHIEQRERWCAGHGPSSSRRRRNFKAWGWASRRRRPFFSFDAGRSLAFLDARGTFASTAAGRDTPVSHPPPARVVSDGPLRARGSGQVPISHPRQVSWSRSRAGSRCSEREERDRGAGSVEAEEGLQPPLHHQFRLQQPLRGAYCGTEVWTNAAGRSKDARCSCRGHSADCTGIAGAATRSWCPTMLVDGVAGGACTQGTSHMEESKGESGVFSHTQGSSLHKGLPSHPRVFPRAACVQLELTKAEALGGVRRPAGKQALQQARRELGARTFGKARAERTFEKARAKRTFWKRAPKEHSGIEHRDCSSYKVFTGGLQRGSSPGQGLHRRSSKRGLHRSSSPEGLHCCAWKCA